MSDQLISQLRALQTQLEKKATDLQNLCNQNKTKMKYYTPVLEEARFILGMGFPKYMFVKGPYHLKCCRLFHVSVKSFTFPILHIHFTCYSLQVGELNQLAKSKVELGKALIRAAEKAKGSSVSSKGAEADGQANSGASKSKRRKTG